VQDATDVYGTALPLLTDGLIAPGISTFAVDLGLDKYTQAFRLSSPTGQKLEWLVGAFYTHEKSTNRQLVTVTDMARQPIPMFTPSLADISLPTSYEEFAAFGDLTYHFNDQFDVLLGARYAHNKQSFRELATGSIVPPTDLPGGSSEGVFTWVVSPRWHVTHDAMVYARVATGYRPGGPNPLLGDAPASFNADKLTNYEVGAKTEFLEHRAIVDLAAFYIDWSKIQLSESNAGATFVGNGGKAESKGFEVQSLFMPLEGLRLGFNAAYTEAKLKSLDPAALVNAFVVGVQLPNVPKWSGSLTADYSWAVSNGWTADVGAGWRYIGKKNSSVVSTSLPNFVLKSYNVLDLNASVSNDRWTVRLYARNLMDERAYTGGGVSTDILNNPLEIQAIVLQPRTIGVSVDLNF
jgi:outer membrane receptor protein involved in Fe transport